MWSVCGSQIGNVGLKIAESAPDIEKAARGLRKPTLPLLVVLDAVAELQAS